MRYAKKGHSNFGKLDRKLPEDGLPVHIDVSVSSVRALRDAQRKTRAMQLYRTLGNLALVAEAMRAEGWENYSRARAGKDVRACLRELAAERRQLTEEYVELELDMLREAENEARAIVELYSNSEEPYARRVALDAINTLLRVSQERRRLLGLDAPKKNETKHVNVNVTAAVVRARKELEDMNVVEGEYEETGQLPEP